MRKRKQMTCILTIAALMLGLAGCAGGSQETAGESSEPASSQVQEGSQEGTEQADAGQAAEGTTITYVTLGDTGMDVLKEAAAAFYEETEIEVKLESWAYSDAYQKILTLAEGGNMPDAMYGFSSWIQEFKEAGYTVALDDLISQEFYDDFSETSINVCKVGEELWALPSYMSIRTVLFNRNRLEEAGITGVPDTWEEFLAEAPKLTDPSSAKYAYTLVAGHPKNTLDCFLPILWAYDADILNEDGTANGFNNEQGIAAFQLYADLAKYSVPDYGQADINSTQNNFTTQLAAAYIHNGQGLAALKEAGEDYSWAEIAKPLAGPNGSRYALGIMDVNLVFNTGNQEAAAQWLEFWHTPEYMGRVVDASGFMPPQASFFEEMPIFTDPENVMVTPFTEYGAIAKFKPSISCWEEVQKVMADAVTKTVMGELTAEEAVASAAQQVDKLLAQ